jgi:hypothetical protein
MIGQRWAGYEMTSLRFLVSPLSWVGMDAAAVSCIGYVIAGNRWMHRVHVGAGRGQTRGVLGGTGVRGFMGGAPGFIQCSHGFKSFGRWESASWMQGLRCARFMHELKGIVDPCIVQRCVLRRRDESLWIHNTLFRPKPKAEGGLSLKNLQLPYKACNACVSVTSPGIIGSADENFFCLLCLPSPSTIPLLTSFDFVSRHATTYNGILYLFVSIFALLSFPLCTS